LFSTYEMSGYGIPNSSEQSGCLWKAADFLRRHFC
jgi:hypothetical protein